MRNTAASTLTSKVTAVALLLALLMIACLLAIGPYLRLSSLREEAASTRELIAALDRRIRGQTQTKDGPPNAKAAPKAEDVFVAGDTAGIAGAALQSRLADLIHRNDGKVKSLLVLPASPSDKSNSVSVNVTANLPINGLQEALYAIELSTPLLFVDDIAVSVVEGGLSKRANIGPVRVDITMRVSGFRPGSRNHDHA